MKTSNLKYLVFASILFLSCGKSPAPDVKPFIKMDINGQNWSPDTIYLGGIYPSTQLFDNDKQFTVSSSSNVVIEGIPYQSDAFGIFLTKKQLGKQIILGAPFSEIYYNYRHSTDTTPVYGVFYTLQQYGEFICEDFEVDNTKSADNWIEITKEEGNFKRIWGKFNINLKRTGIENGCTDVKYTDDTKISNGEFFLEL